MRITRPITVLASAGAALLLALPANADVKTGVDAWAKGDFAEAVAEWRAPASKGDPDAQFNLAQAYRLGRGVGTDPKQAEVYYARAAAQGHLKAADNYGLLMFQDGRREQAMPYVQAAAGRGDPRAQYLLGISHFNGDLVPKDWVQAYALLTLANSAGLPQAKAAIAQMDDFIPLDQRQQSQSVAQQLKFKADAARASQLAAADLGSGGSAVAIAPPTARAPAPVQPARTLPATAAVSVPQPIPTTRVAPSVAAAQAAVEEAMRVTGTDSPANAGADFSRRAAASVPAARPAPAPQPVARTAAAPAQAVRASGPWRVQLGAFSVKANADKLWRSVSRKAALSGTKKFLVPAGRVTRLQAGGFSSRGSAQSACNALKRGGQDCLVTK